MPEQYPKVQSLHHVSVLRDRLETLGVSIPLVDALPADGNSALAAPVRAGTLTIKNRWAIHPMEGWDGTPDGRPTEDLLRRWRRFGASGAALIWGGEAYAVLEAGKANPNQLFHGPHALQDLSLLRETVVEAHRESFGSADGLVVGLQLTHSGRFCRPFDKKRLEPQILYPHPILNPKFGLPMDFPVLSDGEIERIIQAYHQAARTAQAAGFDFVDVKHCHGYLGHECLSARTREGQYGGSFENRTRYLREIVAGIRRDAPGLEIGVRLSAFDLLPFRPDPTAAGMPGVGVPDDRPGLRPYLFGFGADPAHPASRYDLAETVQFLELLRSLDIRLVNLTAGSPYYNPHIQRPAIFPPSDGYLPPEDPLVGVARQIQAVGELKRQFPDMVLVGTGYTYLQEFLGHAAEAAVAGGHVDLVGIGRMVLSYPTLPADLLQHGQVMHRKQICRTFSDCTTGPRNGLPSGCYPLDDHYKNTEAANQLKVLKAAARHPGS